MIIRSETDYLLLKSKEICKDILLKESLTDTDIIDFLINLHLVLEIGLNTFYRHIILMEFKKNISYIEVANNLDNISFVDKTILFFYLPHFDFKENLHKAKDYHSAIEKLKSFNEVRNKLLHGHMIGEVVQWDENRQSRTFKLITVVNMNKQMDRFKSILEAVTFFFNHMELALSSE